MTQHPSVGEDAADRDHPSFDTSVAHQARIYDYWLGGKDNYAADRAAGDATVAAYPDTRVIARANRGFLSRAVRYLAEEAGVRQFLDIGTGIPTAGNTHEVAQEIAPECRVVYVDYDPVVLAHARALLTSSPEGATEYVDADLRDPGPILEQAARTLDFTRPVAVMLIAVLHVIEDRDRPGQIVRTLMDATVPGSCLALSHMASDIDAEKVAAAKERLNRLSHQQFLLRSRDEVGAFFGGLELAAPGLVAVNEWRAVAGSGPVAMWGGVARKPGEAG